MLVTKKMLLALGLVGALVGAGIGALATRSTQSTSAANTNYDTTRPVYDTTRPIADNERTAEQIAANNSAQYSTTAEQGAYRQGFDAGYSVCNGNTGASSRSVVYEPGSNYREPGPSYRTVRSRRYGTRRVYYDYGSRPRGRSFWQKHRDKLTLAMGTGIGAAIGGLAGGKKGAGIGALAGLGGSALYTYKLRKRHRNY
jgi:hypothetical protein